MRHCLKATASMATLLTLPLVIALSSAASAQTKSVELFPDHTARPLFATIVGRHGAFTDTLRIDVEAGGANFIAVPDLFCDGAIDYAQPDATIDYRQGAGPVSRLNIMVLSKIDTILVMRLPDGSWQCDDDSGTNNAPVISIVNPTPGQYAIWAGTFAGGVGEAVVTITEDGFPPESGLQVPNAAAPAQKDVLNLEAGLPTDPIEMDVSAGGNEQIPEFLAFCSGNFDAAQPTLHIDNAPVGQRFSIDLTSDEDTVLAVITPGGEWLCNDDQFGSDPQVTVEAAEFGRYSVWAGTFSDIGKVAATLTVSEGGGILRGVIPQADLSSQVGDILLSEVILGQPFSHEITTGGTDEIADLGPECAGIIDAGQPTAHIENPTAGEDFEIRVTSIADTTLIILAPNGEWFCSDDFFELDPAVYFSDASAGRYTIWVGTFDRGSGRPLATLTVDRAAG